MRLPALVCLEQESTIPLINKELCYFRMVGAAEIEPCTRIFGAQQLRYTSCTKASQFFANPPKQDSNTSETSPFVHRAGRP